MGKRDKGINFNSFLTSGDYSDLKVKCEDETFNCHKVVLATASPVINAMIKNEKPALDPSR